MDQGSLWNKVYEQRSQDELQRQGQLRTEREGRILAIDGCYDHWADVIPHVRAAVKDVIEPGLSPQDLPRPLKEYHLIALGCPGNENTPELLDAILAFIREGGFVLTTDWALGKVITHSKGGNDNREWLPQTVVRAPESTDSGDYLVDYVKKVPNHPLLRGLPDGGEWTITGISHVIEVLDRSRVNVLLESRKLVQQFGHGTLLFETRIGQGMLVHFISHAYAQSDDIQGASAAMMLLANLFDMATAGAVASGTATGGASPGWMRLHGHSSGMVVTLKASGNPEDLQLTRNKVKLILSDMADQDGNPMHKYVNPETPIAEFSWTTGAGWKVRVPSGSSNGLAIDGTRIGTDWVSIRNGQSLALFSTRQNRVLSEMPLRIEIPG